MCSLLDREMHWYSAWALWLLIIEECWSGLEEEDLSDQKYREGRNPALKAKKGEGKTGPKLENPLLLAGESALLPSSPCFPRILEVILDCLICINK